MNTKWASRGRRKRSSTLLLNAENEENSLTIVTVEKEEFAELPREERRAIILEVGRQDAEKNYLELSLSVIFKA